jgi:hypothetical protein
MSKNYVLRKNVYDEKLHEHVPDDFAKRLKKHDKLRRTLLIVAKLLKVVLTDDGTCARIDSIIAELGTDRWYDAMIEEIKKTCDSSGHYYEKMKMEEVIQKKYWRLLKKSEEKWGI